MEWASYLLPRNQSRKSKRITRDMCIPSSIWPDASSASRPNVTSQRLHRVPKGWDGLMCDGITADHCDLSESHPAYNQGDRKVNLGLCLLLWAHEIHISGISRLHEDHVTETFVFFTCISISTMSANSCYFFSFFRRRCDMWACNRRRGSSWVTRYLLWERKWPDGWGSQVSWSSFLKVNE